MADQSISQLPVATTLTGNELTVVVQNGITKQAQVSQIGGGGGTGTVTSITAGTGLTGGTITTSGTIALANTTVTPGAYTNANITVDERGRVTAAANGTGGGITFPIGTEIVMPYTGNLKTIGTQEWLANDNQVYFPTNMSSYTAAIPFAGFFSWVPASVPDTNTMTPPSMNQWSDMIFDGTKFLAVSTSAFMDGFNRVISSTDKTTWTEVTLPGALDNPFLVYGAGRYLIFNGANSSVNGYSSTDGVNWTAVTFDDTVSAAGAIFDGTKFVFVSYGSTTNGGVSKVYTSTNGTTWAAQATLVTTAIAPILSFANSFYVIQDPYSFMSSSYVYSSDLITWNNESLPFITGNQYIIRSGNGIFVSVRTQNGGALEYLTTTNPSSQANWTQRNMPVSLPDITQLVFSGNSFFMCSEFQTGYLSSSNGIDWISNNFLNVPGTNLIPHNNFITYGLNSEFVTVPNQYPVQMSLTGLKNYIVSPSNTVNQAFYLRIK